MSYNMSVLVKTGAIMGWALLVSISQALNINVFLLKFLLKRHIEFRVEAFV